MEVDGGNAEVVALPFDQHVEQAAFILCLVVGDRGAGCRVEDADGAISEEGGFDDDGNSS